jgi:hypothetical protein
MKASRSALHDLVREQQQEPVRKEQRHAATLAGAYAREELEQSFERGQPRMIMQHWPR